MNDCKDVLENLKDLISIEHGNKKVFDKDIALYLGICHKKLSYYKRNNKLPIKELSLFCRENRISLEYLFFQQTKKRLKK